MAGNEKLRSNYLYRPSTRVMRSDFLLNSILGRTNQTWKRQGMRQVAMTELFDADLRR
jgi:hypothetical protein